MKRSIMIAMALLALFCNCQKPLEEECVIEKQPYYITSERDITDVDEYVDGILIFKRIPDELKSLVPVVTHTLFDYRRPAHIISYEYESIGPDGKPVMLSAALLVPSHVYKGIKKADKLVLASHFSSMRYDECPTLSSCIEGLLAWRNAIVVMPDYYGFGSSRDKVQAYLNPDMAGRDNLDALVAAEILMEDKLISIPRSIINIGYSQGGYNAVATVKYLSEHPEYDIRFDHTYAGGGPYEVLNTFTSYLNGGYDTVFPLILVTLTSFNEIEGLGVDYADVFKEPLLSNYREWVLYKKYDTQQVTGLLGSTRATDHLTDKFTSQSGPVFGKFTDTASKYSLNKGWVPDPDMKISLFHSKDDDMVPYSNYESMAKYLEGKCRLEKISLSGFSHVSGYAAFIVNVILKIWPEANR